MIEILLKCFAYGLYYLGPKSYLKNKYNIIDTVIVFIGVNDSGLIF